MHYFSEKPTSKSEIKVIEEILRGKLFKFKTDSGVFSHNKIDKGTKLLIETVEVNKEDEILDLGCGYGAIGIALADEVKKVLMVDINRRALKLAKENVKLNNIKNAEVRFSDLYENVDEKFDKIITNPPIRAGKDVVKKIVSEALNHLKDGGELWMVIQTKQGAKSMAKYMEEVFGNVETVKIKGGYRILKSKKVRE
ncbi:class I SAM-dependent methyltransferase [Methanocaldococcus infernus]|uniref:Methyltransferase small n=1 Tax=Methanocaldococcus infernus (strain DSM 11812 / JCM 15783 / ME) TaxID=573063 RepID=D5VTI9_METIM|nr:class I SAM-dependent methyltransferase [Methanocaldococcus infernus]ADG13892.1 methyltransferase small [Methanocaldococcus infernus ME]